MALFFFSLSLAAYFFLHSLLADERVKKAISPALLPARKYRIAYNLLALALLVPVGWLFSKVEKTPLFTDADFLAIAGWAFLAAGAIWIWKAMAGYDLGEFSGFTQLKKEASPQHSTLKTNGLNSLVRHPLYFGTLLMVWGWFLISPAKVVLAAAILSSVYLFVGAKLEERKLAQQFGEAYRLYRRRVPMLVPIRFSFKKNTSGER